MRRPIETPRGQDDQQVIAIAVDCIDLDRLAEVIADKPDFPWVALADPEGNEFYVLPPG